jgi:hypothetical protein
MQPRSQRKVSGWFLAWPTENAGYRHGRVKRTAGPGPKLGDEFGCPIRGFCVWGFRLAFFFDSRSNFYPTLSIGRVARALNWEMNLGAPYAGFACGAFDFAFFFDSRSNFYPTLSTALIFVLTIQ